jgi:hypothetical protein
MEVHFIGKCDVTREEVYDLRAFFSACGEFSLHAIRFFQNFVSLKGCESGEEHPPSASSPLPDLQSQYQINRERERKKDESAKSAKKYNRTICHSATADLP